MLSSCCCMWYYYCFFLLVHCVVDCDDAKGYVGLCWFIITILVFVYIVLLLCFHLFNMILVSGCYCIFRDFQKVVSILPAIFWRQQIGARYCAGSRRFNLVAWRNTAKRCPVLCNGYALRITLIGGPAGWRAVFPNEKRYFRRAAHMTEDRAGGLHERAVWWAFPQPAFMCSSLAHPVVQHAGLTFCATRQKFMLFIWKDGPPARPALFSVTQCYGWYANGFLEDSHLAGFRFVFFLSSFSGSALVLCLGVGVVRLG